MEEEIQNNENSGQQDDQPVKNENQNKSLLFIVIAFLALVAFIFLKSQILGEKEPIAWLTDYDAAVETAKSQNKPLLLMFYKQFAPMYISANNNTYNDQKVKDFVESNFIPVAIDCDAQPDIARKFKIGYYPTHYVKHPARNKLFGPRNGWDEPPLFIKEMQLLLDEFNDEYN